jgi:rhamnosyl/mannosyltransferase
VRVVVVNHADSHGRDTTFQRWTSTQNQIDFDGPIEILRVGRLASIARLDICPDLLTTLRRIQSQEVDLFHLHTPNPTMLLALVALGTRTPIVITHHSDVIRQKILRHFLTPFEHRIYGKARAIVASSPPYVEGSPLLQRHRDRVEIIPFGIDLSDYLNPSERAKSIATQWKNLYGDPLWLMVGRLIYYKGIDTALRSLREVPGKLVIVGTGPLRDPLSRLAEELGVADRVIWKGHVEREELIGAYHAATAFWFPSNARSEAFGLVQVEAMACGCPVINTNIPGSGVPWVSQHGVSGLTVEIDSPREFAQVCEQVLNPVRRQQLHDSAKKRVVTLFNQSRMFAETITTYRRIVG